MSNTTKNIFNSSLILDDFITSDSVETLFNKTINSADNNLLVNGTNINTLINQPLSTTSLVTHKKITLNNDIISDVPLVINKTATSGFPMIELNKLNDANFISFQQATVDKLLFGYNPFGSESYMESSGPIRLTTFGAQITIPNTFSIDNTAEILGIRPNSLLYKRNDIVTLSGLQTITNKTINTLTNSILLSGVSNTNINNLIDQDIRINASPTFINETLTGQLNTNNIQTYNTNNVNCYFHKFINDGTFEIYDSNNVKIQKEYSYILSIPIGGSIDLVIFITQTNYCYTVSTNATITQAGTNGNIGTYYIVNACKNNNGVLTGFQNLYNDKKETGGVVGGKITLTNIVSGVNLITRVTSTSSVILKISGITTYQEIA